jgi:hypothetical protein
MPLQHFRLAAADWRQTNAAIPRRRSDPFSVRRCGECDHRSGVPLQNCRWRRLPIIPDRDLTVFPTSREFAAGNDDDRIYRALMKTKYLLRGVFCERPADRGRVEASGNREGTIR